MTEFLLNVQLTREAQNRPQQHIKRYPKLLWLCDTVAPSPKQFDVNRSRNTTHREKHKRGVFIIIIFFRCAYIRLNSNTIYMHYRHKTRTLNRNDPTRIKERMSRRPTFMYSTFDWSYRCKKKKRVLFLTNVNPCACNIQVWCYVITAHHCTNNFWREKKIQNEEDWWCKRINGTLCWLN